MSSIWNNGVAVSIFGESHSEAIGVILDNLPAGVPIDFDRVQQMMRRRQAKSDGTTTTRVEPDIPRVLSGYYDGKTTGTPLAMVMENTNTRSKDYSELAVKMRPGHADYTGHLRYAGANDIRGGGHFSGRLTACLVAAGAVCGQILEAQNIVCGAKLLSVGGVYGERLDPVQVTREDLRALQQLAFPVPEESVRQEIIDTIQNARMSLDSVGGIVECAAVGMPAGIGSPMMDGIESLLSSLFFAIPGVKGVEFGDGFDVATRHGSENNDPFTIQNGKVVTTTNHAGGILGGISSGMPITARVAFKPTPSIAREQRTVNIETMEDTTLSIIGRHDPCIAVRAVPVVEACMNIGLLSAILMQPTIK